MQGKKKNRILIRAAAFLLGLVLLLCAVQQVFILPSAMTRNTYRGFYVEGERPLDAVYLGTSTSLIAWQAPLAWERYGYAIYSFSMSNTPLRAIKYLLEEARKTQPDALYIIGLNRAKTDKISASAIHYVSDYMPMSRTKLKMLDDLCTYRGAEGADRLEYLFPFVRYHTAWDEMDAGNAFRKEHLKGAVRWSTFLQTISNISGNYFETTEEAVLPEETVETLEELMDYCRKEQVNVLFTLIPQGVTDKEERLLMNAAVRMVEEAGFPVLNMFEAVGEMGLDLAGDFYNYGHLNVHGALKFMDYLSAYLGEHYGFEDKRGDPAYQDWDEAAAEYHEIIDNYLLDFELDSAPRDNTITKALMLEQKSEGRIAWLRSSGGGVDGYAIYRQELDEDGEPGDWEHIGDVSGDATTYQDETAAPGVRYRYTAAPYVYRDGVRVYGQIDALGSVKEA